ncbi:nucleotide pyrophosphohydrolase [Vagococcus humatus]|uniref:Nucleotide pyrophosphohydrolase n=1 Tax=Vagococcus humatus TaxID=1889241 RepID=A0A429Z7X9_9ENTE|nr:nucleotide pyrophosphohydrolase [Vagococcus humatus]RST89735.1 nucleotide pyrophosphohydrolase [Vagococcus humatus]
MTDKKTMEEMQCEVDEYIQQFKEGYFSPLVQVLRLTEELGELAREVNHYYGPKAKKSSEPAKSVEEELGDVLISLIIMANSLDISLEDVFKENMDKFYHRDFYRFARKDGKVREQDD